MGEGEPSSLPHREEVNSVCPGGGGGEGEGRLALMLLMGANPLLGPLEGVGPENLDFRDPPLPMAIEMDLLAPIKIITSRAI